MDVRHLVDRGKQEEQLHHVLVFLSQIEMRHNVPFKLYQINQDYDCPVDHTHDYFQIWYVKKGEFIHQVNQQKYRMVAGNMYILPPYLVHRLEMIPGKHVEIIGCEFLPHFINDQFPESFHYFLSDEGLSHSQMAFTGGTDLQVKRLLDKMLQEYNGQQPNYDLMIKGGLLMLLTLIIREWNRMPSESQGKAYKRNELMESVVDYIQCNYKEAIRLDDICKRALVSRTYFCDMFKQYTGKTFSEYVIDLRLSKSMELLLSSDMNVTDICFHVGFNHLTHFSKMFKRHTGVSPMHYKKNARK